MTNYDKLAADLPDVAEQPPAAPVLYTVADTDPDAEAGLRTLSKSTGIPVEALRLKPQADEARRIDAANKHDGILNASPKTAGFLQDPIAAAVSHDDVENMGFMERIISGLDDLSFRATVAQDKNRQGKAGYVDKLFAGGVKPLVTEQDFKERADKMFASGLFPTQQEAADAVRRQIKGFVRPGDAAMSPGRAGQATPGAIGDWISNIIPSSIGQAWSGISQTVADLTGLDQAAAQVAREQEKSRAQDALMRPDFGGETANAVASGVESTAQQLPGLATSYLTGGTAPGLAYIGAMVYGPAYSKYRGRGASPGMAILGAGGETVTEVLTEKIPMGETLRALESATGGRWKQAATRYLSASMSEVKGEQAATLIQDAIDTAVANPNKTWAEYIAERPDASYQTLVATLTQTALMAGAGGAARIPGQFGYTPPEQKQLRSEASAQLIEQLNKGAAASKVLARDPETFQSFIKSAAEGGPVTDVYIDANVLNQSGLAEQVLAASPAAAEQYQEALATGGQVRIPIDEYAARIAPQEYAQQLLDDLRLQPEDMSRREAQEYAQSGAMQDLEAAVAAVVGNKTQDDTFAASRDRVRQQVLDNLNALGRFTPQKNELDATLIAARSATRAAQLGVTPEQFFNDYLLKVTAKGMDGEVLNQFAGQNAETADLSALDKAKQRIAAGEDAEAVRKDTGWFKGADGKMRFEINDADAKLAMDRLTWGEAKDLEQGNTTSLPLGRLLDHPALFAAYPSLENYWVRVIPGMKSASFNPESNTIAIGYDKATKQADLSALLHEIQHAIQENEGFASGGSLDSARKVAYEKNENRRKQINEEIEELGRLRSSIPTSDNYAYQRNVDKHKALVSERDALNEEQRGLKYDQAPAAQAYKRLAGEVEARNTQARANMTDAERQATSPQSTADVAERDQIVLNGQGGYGTVSTMSNDPGVVGQQSQSRADGTNSGGETQASAVFVTKKDGEYYPVEAVKVESYKDAGVDILPGGHIRLRYSGVGIHAGNRYDYSQAIEKALRELIYPKQVDGVFYRFTNNKNELSLIESGEIRPSKNHADGYSEAGLSVADGPHYGIFGHKYGYLVTGNVVGTGSDGEPLLDVKSIKPLSKITTSASITKKHSAQVAANKKSAAKAIGWTEDQFDSAFTSISYKFMDSKGFYSEAASSGKPSNEQPQQGQSAGTENGGLFQTAQPFTATTIEIDGIARPTTNSAGNPIHSTEAGIRNFWAWFGDSKIVDEQGRPLVVYHGTGGDFDAFDRNKGGEASGNSAGKKGHFFSGSTAIASDYALRAKGNPNVMPAFLALPKPTNRKFRDIDQLDYWASVNDFSGGLMAETGDGQRVFMVKDANQIKSATGNAGTFSGETDNILYQPDGGPGPVKRGSFSPSTNTIALLKNADLSTFLHESGHYFFETDIAIAGQILRENGAFGIDTMTPGQQQILRDVSALLKWHGIEGDIASQIDQWDRMDFEERRGYHEKTAESFERYLMEGKAPSIELQQMFQSFRQWLLSVYKSLKAFLVRNPDAGELSDEVRAVFDRMLATEEEIRLAEQARSMLPLFADAVNAGMTPSEFAEYQKLGNEATRAAIDELQAKGMRDMKWLSNARSRMLKKLQKQAKAQRAEVRAQVRMEVMQEPVYQAWNLLTAKMTAEDQLAANKPKRSASVDPTSDSLFEAIAKMGGLNKATLVSQWGIDPKDKADSGLFGKPVMRAKDGGASLDAMVEALTEEGYLTPDENGKGDVAELEEKFQAELRGDKQYSRIKDYEPDALAGQGEDVSGVTAARIDRASLDDMEGLASWVIGRLEVLGMTARTGGMHPDVLSEVLPGWTSGDELVRAIVAARPLKEEIEARTDQRMIEQYSELATPEALEQAADIAIHNDARERFLATEYNALAKATGERKMLLEAARGFARQLIGRQRIRDIRPGQYTAAETRAAKAAMAAKDIGQKAAEKRNQILSGMAAREAYRAKEDVDKGLRYLKKFESPTIRKRISGDYVDQIEKLLEAIDLRKRSLTDIDRRKSFGAFVRSQIEKGIVPVMSDSLLPPNLRAAYVAKVMERNADGELIIKDDVEQAKVLADFLDMAETRPYKDMTVEEFRGLIDTIRQIEHLGRKKKSLLTARDGKTYEQKRDELAESVAANSEKLPSRLNRVIPSKMSERLSGLRDFKMSLRKVGMIMRLLDGNKDGGPMWDFFVRSANERGDWETEMIAKSSEVLTKALRPLFKMKGKMRGKGIYFESLGRSLNREQRIGLALNVGNEGNLQRLLDGEGWTYADIKPVLESLTEAEWVAVQEVWDHMDSYRPMIAAIEKRTVGAEPEWVQPMQFMVQTADGKTLTLKGGYYPVKYDTEASARSEQLQDATDAKAAMDAAYGSSTTHRSFVKKRSEMVVGRPLELSLSGMYSGVQDVIHDLAWREWLLDASKMAESKTLDAVIRDKHGAETVRAIKDWIKDIAAGTKKPRGKMDRAIGFMRRNVAAAGLAINFMNAVQNVTGIQNSIERVGVKWIAVGQKEFLSDIKGASAWVSEKSSLMRNRARTQFRDLNDLRNIVEKGDGIVTKARANQFILMTTTQRIVDMPTWIGAYRKAEADGAVVQYEDGSIDDSKAIAMADQAVIDAQGSGMTKDLSGIERGSEAEKLFTVYYSYMNTTYNLGANRIAGARGGNAKERGSAAFHIMTLMMVPVVAMAILKAALTPGDDDDWDDPEKLAKNLGNSQMSYLFGMVPIVREFFPMMQPFVADQSFGYQGPSGMRMAGDAVKFTQQAKQGEFDDGFRKAAVGLSGSLFGLPAAQINRTWTGIEAIADDKTNSPAALLFGFQE